MVARALRALGGGDRAPHPAADPGRPGLPQAPQQAYRSCLGILGLAGRYTTERLEAACRRALPAGICSYKGIKNILDTRLDQLLLEEAVSAVAESHANIRGPSYYR